jgi:type IV pilus assembly protein PilN
MIRINLMTVERGRAKPRIGIETGQKITLACAVIFISVLGLVGWQAYTLREETAQLEAQLSSVDQELASMAEVVEQRNEFEAQSAELARRVTLIEQLREGQGGPVRMLDQVSRAVPEGVWFTELRQDGAEITMQGRATGLTGISDLMAAMEASGYFAPPVEIVDSQLEAQGAGEVVRFELKATFRSPSS